jgi:hypothetical protein
MQILGTGTRDVEINVPLNVKGALSTFDNNMSIGGGLGVGGSTTLGGAVSAMDNLSVNGLLKAPQLRITGSDTNHNIVIENNVVSEVARFYNDDRCRFNGDTTILGKTSVSGELYSAGPVLCNQTLKVIRNTTH